jgi:hypothetical protein
VWVDLLHSTFFDRSHQIISKSFDEMVKASRIVLDQKLKEGFEQDEDVSDYVWSQKVTFDEAHQDRHSIIYFETPTVVLILQSIKSTSAKAVEDLIPLIRFFLDKEMKYAKELERFIRIKIVIPKNFSMPYVMER